MRQFPHVKLGRALDSVLHLRRGDLRHGLMFGTHLFLIIGGYVAGQVARDALFLEHFAADRLPFVDIGSVVLVAAASAAYIRVARRTSLERLTVAGLLAFASVAAASWLLLRLHAGSWLYPTTYLWVSLFGVVAPAQVWTLAGYVLNPREAKRIYGLLSGGATLGAIAGGALANLLARHRSVEALLLVLAACAALAAALAAAAARDRRAAPLGTLPPQAPSSHQGPRTLRESLSLVLSSSGLRTIAGLIVISSLVTSIIGWQFKAFAQRELVNKEALAPFFGSFNAIVGALSLLLQMFVTPRLLRRVELGSVLLVLPAALTIGSGLLLSSGAFFAAVSLRLGDKVLRYAVDRPAVELLYLPLPASLRAAAKSFIDTVVWRFGDGLAGIAVLGFVTIGGLGPLGMGWVALAALALWIALAVSGRNQYLAMLRDAIQRHRFDAERTALPALDRASTELLAARLDAVDPAEILYALDMLAAGATPARHPAVHGLLRHGDPRVRERALQILSGAGECSVLREVEPLLRDADPGVRTEALLFLARYSDVDPVARLHELGDFPEYSIRAALVAGLARSGEDNLELARQLLLAMAEETGADGTRTRLAAARLGASLPQPLAEPLARLIADPEPEVARAAIVAASRLGPLPFFPQLLARLRDRALGGEAASALAASGDAAVPPLRAALDAPDAALDVKREIPAILARIRTQAAIQVLTDHVLEPDSVLRTRVLSALNKLRGEDPDLPLDTSLIETALAAEILGAYRSCQILHGLGGDARTARGLEEAMRLEHERVFRLLALVLPGHDFHSAHVGLGSSDPVVRGQAVDFLENVLKPGMRRLLLPLIDPDVALEERARLAARVVGPTLDGPQQAVTALAGTNDAWLQSCAAYAIGALELVQLAGTLDRLADEEDPLLRETVRQAKARLLSITDGTDDGR